MRSTIILSLAGLGLSLPTTIPGTNTVSGLTHDNLNDNPLPIPRAGTLANIDPAVADNLADPTNPFHTPNAGSTINNAVNEAGLARRRHRGSSVGPVVGAAGDVAGDAVRDADQVTANAVNGATDVGKNAVGSGQRKRGDIAHGAAAGLGKGAAAGAVGDLGDLLPKRGDDGATGAAAGSAAGNAEGAVGDVAGAVLPKRGDIAKGAAAGLAKGQAAGAIGDVGDLLPKRGEDPLAWGAAAGSAAGAANGAIGNIGKELGRD